MKIFFPENDPEKNVSSIEEELGGRKLGKMVKFILDDGNLKVKISKLGTSELNFSYAANGDGMTWELSKEKIALSHKAFKDEVMDKIFKIIKKVGGEIS